MSQSDDEDDPGPESADTREFFLPGMGVSALLIHGLTGTPYEMRYLGNRLAAAGVRVLGVRLAGHGGTPEELGLTTHDNWYESVVTGMERLRQYGEPIVAVGLSVGAVLAARLAVDQREAITGLVMLAPAFFLPRWPQVALRLVRPLRPFADRIYLRSREGPDIHDTAARDIHPGTRLMPLSAALDVVELAELVRRKLPEVVQPALVIQSRHDHTCPYQRNTAFVMAHLGSTQKRLVTLNESYHVITVDFEKDRVAQETLDFTNQFRAAAHAATALGA